MGKSPTSDPDYLLRIRIQAAKNGFRLHNVEIFGLKLLRSKNFSNGWLHKMCENRCHFGNFREKKFLKIPYDAIRWEQFLRTALHWHIFRTHLRPKISNANILETLL